MTSQIHYYGQEANSFGAFLTAVFLRQLSATSNFEEGWIRNHTPTVIRSLLYVPASMPTSIFPCDVMSRPVNGRRLLCSDASHALQKLVASKVSRRWRASRRTVHFLLNYRSYISSRPSTFHRLEHATR
jgi:hypothetical protein